MNDNSRQIDRIEKDFAKKVKQLRRSILRTAIAGLLGYALTGSSTTFTIGNINTSRTIGARIRAVGRRSRKGLLSFLLDSLSSLFDKNQEFYQGEGSTESVDSAARKKILLLYGYDIDKKEIITGGYLDETLNMSGVAQQVGTILNQQLATRATLSNMRKALQSALGGKSNIVDSHFRRFTRDLFAEYDRAVKLEYKERLGLEHGLYLGTDIDTSRQFCIDRRGNVYTEKEILSWNDLEWKGKKPGDVRIVCGGYNCRDSIVWVSEGTANAVAKERGGFNTYNN